MAIGQFGKGKATSNGGPKAPPPAAKKSRWAGTKSSKPLDPVIHAGKYRLEILRGEPGRTGEWFKVHFKIVDQGEGQTMHETGDQTVILLRLIDDAGMSRAKAFFVAAAGYEDDDSYDAVDADGAMIDAFFERGADSDLAGRLVDVHVRRGKDTPDGDYYREFEWAPVADEEQASQ